MTQHPLQRLSSPSVSFSLIFHLLGIASFSNSFHFLTIWETPINDAYGWHFQFFTIIGLALSLACFIFGALADITSISFLFRIKNYIAILAAPLEVTVSILYWGLVAIDPNLVLQEDIHIPIWSDIGFHLAPSILLILDLVFFSPPWTIPAYGVMSISTVFGFAYWFWVEFCFSKNGWYPYPLFALLSTTQRVLLFTFAALLVTAASSTLKWVYAQVNGYPIAAKEAHKPFKKIQ